jgi:hypothetical protein
VVVKKDISDAGRPAGASTINCDPHYSHHALFNTGPEGDSAKMLKGTATSIAYSQTKLFNSLSAAAYIRPHLIQDQEYFACVWDSYLLKGVDLLESVQKFPDAPIQYRPAPRSF